jgi:hypothetical protein
MMLIAGGVIYFYLWDKGVCNRDGSYELYWYGELDDVTGQKMATDYADSQTTLQRRYKQRIEM